MRLACGFLAFALVGCVSQPPKEDASYAGPHNRGGTDTPVLSQDSTQRYARDITYRVRNPGCNGVASGSAFAIAPDTLVTNKHVVEGGVLSLELSTWDGKDITVDVYETSIVADLAFIKTSQSVPVVAKMGKDPKEGLRVAAVGYPLGGPWSLSQGRIRQYIDGDSYGIGHRVLLFDATVEPGNSGGPLMDRDGLVVGVVFAKERDGEELGLAIPVSTLEKVRLSGSLQPPVYSC